VKGTPSERLELASIRGTVRVDLAKHKRVTFVVDDPRINMIFDADLYAAAKCILSYRSSFQESHDDDLAELRAARERLVVSSKKSLEHGRELLSRSTRAGMAAIEGVVGSLGRLIGAGSTDSTPLTFRPGGADLPSKSQSRSTDSNDAEVTTMSFEDFIADDDDGEREKKQEKETPERSGRGGGWFATAAVGLVGGIGKLLGADKETSKSESLFVRPAS